MWCFSSRRHPHPPPSSPLPKSHPFKPAPSKTSKIHYRRDAGHWPTNVERSKRPDGPHKSDRASDLPDLPLQHVQHNTGGPNQPRRRGGHAPKQPGNSGGAGETRHSRRTNEEPDPPSQPAEHNARRNRNQNRFYRTLTFLNPNYQRNGQGLQPSSSRQLPRPQQPRHFQSLRRPRGLQSSTLRPTPINDDEGQRRMPWSTEAHASYSGNEQTRTQRYSFEAHQEVVPELSRSQRRGIEGWLAGLELRGRRRREGRRA